MGKSIWHGTARSSKDGSNGGAFTTGSGKGTEDDPHIHTTTSVDEDGNTSGSHTTVESDESSVTISSDD